jgi:putative Holliday junction resolvase
MSGAVGARALQAESFAQALGAAVGVPIELQDERLTTVEANRVLDAAGVRGRRRRDVVDRTAATVILQAWLDAHRER